MMPINTKLNIGMNQERIKESMVINPINKVKFSLVVSSIYRNSTI
jgi:hypothetical protein